MLDNRFDLILILISILLLVIIIGLVLSIIYRVLEIMARYQVYKKEKKEFEDKLISSAQFDERG
jgi:hypothetical protein